MNRFFQKVGHVLYSIRPSACFMVAVFVIAAFRPSAKEIEIAVKLFITAFAGSAFCFLVNDIYDRKKDQLNNKNRPIATGKLSVNEAYGSVSVFGLIYLGFSFMLGKTVFVLALVSLFFFLIYSPANRKGGVAANIIVAICASGSIWGVAILRNFDATLFYISSLLFMMIIVREILLDWLDMKGDTAIGKPSIPIALGLKSTILVLTILLVTVSAGIVAAPFWITISNLSMACLGIALVATWLPFLKLSRERTDENVLFNIRFSHVTFIFFVLGIMFR